MLSKFVFQSCITSASAAAASKTIFFVSVSAKLLPPPLQLPRLLGLLSAGDIFLLLLLALCRIAYSSPFFCRLPLQSGFGTRTELL